MVGWVPRGEVDQLAVPITTSLLQVAMASSSIGSLQTPLVNLELQVSKPNSTNESETFELELSHDELQNLISSLDSCNKVSGIWKY